MLEVTKLSDNAFFAQNNDVRNCEAIVFAESVRTGRTMLQVINYVLEEDDSDTNLLCACETLQEEIVKAYKKQILEQYLDEQLYNVQQSK
jgi:phage terminase large subunit GpA-like protein